VDFPISRYQTKASFSVIATGDLLGVTVLEPQSHVNVEKPKIPVTRPEETNGSDFLVEDKAAAYGGRGVFFHFDVSRILATWKFPL
jgi:hypothetical protein